MIGGDYILQVGDVDFGNSGGGMEALIFQRQARGYKAPYTFNLPSKFLWGVVRAGMSIIQESGVKEYEM